MTAYIIVTVNNSTIRADMDNFDGTELVAGQSTFLCWHWVNPAPANLTSAQALTGYLGTVQIS